MSKMTLPMVAMPAAISESVAAVLKVHGLSLTPDLLREIGNNATQALFGLDVSLMSDAPEPSTADLLAVGETLRGLAHAGRPNAEAAPSLACVGRWLCDIARADLATAKSTEAA